MVNGFRGKELPSTRRRFRSQLPRGCRVSLINLKPVGIRSSVIYSIMKMKVLFFLFQLSPRRRCRANQLKEQLAKDDYETNAGKKGRVSSMGAY